MKRSSIVFLPIKKDVNFSLNEITSLVVYNRGSVPVKINGFLIYSNEERTLVIADGTVSNVDLEIVFDKSKIKTEIYNKVIDNFFTGTQELELIYKKLALCNN